MTGFIALLMGAGAILHFAMPDIFTGLVFAPLPPYPVIYVSGVIEACIAVAILLPKTRAVAALTFALLCTVYMPLHLWDLVRDDPVIAPLWLAATRALLQVAFIWMGWSLWRATR